MNADHRSKTTLTPIHSNGSLRIIWLAFAVVLCPQCAIGVAPGEATAWQPSPDQRSVGQRPTRLHDQAAGRTTVPFGVPESISGGFGNRFNGFTKPVQEIEVSSPESGRLASVHVKRGDTVQKNQLMIELDTNILEASRRVASAKSKATAQIDALVVEAKLRQERHLKLRRLYDDGAGSIEEVLRSEADATVAALKVDAAREDANLRSLELAEIEARIELRRVRSPIAGVVTDVTKDAGEYVSLQQPHVVTVVQLDRLRVTFFVPTFVAYHVAPAESIRLLLPDSQTFCDGRIEHVGAVTKADSGRVRVDVLIDNPKNEFRSGILCQWSPSTTQEQD